MERHTELYPEDARALYLGATAWLLHGDRNRCVEWLGRALAIDPEETTILYNAACTYSLMGEKDQALNLLEKAVPQRIWPQGSGSKTIRISLHCVTIPLPSPDATPLPHQRQIYTLVRSCHTHVNLASFIFRGKTRRSDCNRKAEFMATVGYALRSRQKNNRKNKFPQGRRRPFGELIGSVESRSDLGNTAAHRPSEGEGIDMFNRITAFLYGVVLLSGVFRNVLVRDRFPREFRRPEVHRFRSPVTIHKGVGNQCRVAGIVRHSAQHYGAAMVQGRVDPDRACPSRAQYICAVLQPRSASCCSGNGNRWVVWSGVWRNTAGRLALIALFAAGWLTVLVATFLINHFDLFGLRQVWLHLLRRPYTSLKFRTPGLYRLVRHPLYVGWLMGVLVSPCDDGCASGLRHRYYRIHSHSDSIRGTRPGSELMQSTPSIAAGCR